jgi:thioredoxin reductase
MGGQEVWDAAIVGGGPAGLSAALLLARARRRVIVFDDNRPRNAVVQQMHGFLTREGINPREFIAIARDQVRRYSSVKQMERHVVAARGTSGEFQLESDDGESHRARALLLATGVYDQLPDIDGLRALWGRKVFVCPYCDGWELAGRRIAVVGRGRRCVQLAQELRQWSDNLLVCLEATDELRDVDRLWLSSVSADVRHEAIASLRELDGRVRIEFRRGNHDFSDAVFLAAPLRQRYPLVAMLNVRVRPDGEIDTDAHGRTNVSGCYAAGDAVTTVHQVTLAAASGICAAMSLNEDLTQSEVRAAIEAQRRR